MMLTDRELLWLCAWLLAVAAAVLVAVGVLDVLGVR